MKTDIWMPIFIGEYMQQTLHLSRAEHGSCLLLMTAYWSNGGPLKDEGDRLRMICRCPLEEWASTKATLSELFVVEGGLWRHERLDAELGKARSLSSLRKKVGVSGACKRWQNDSKANGKQHGKGNAFAIGETEGVDSKPMANAIAIATAEAPDTPENGKTMANAMANSMANGCQLPSPLPVPIENREIEGALPEIPPMTRPAYEAMAEMRGIPKACYDWFWNTCEGTGWLDFRGRPIRKVEPLLLNLFVKWRQNDFKSRGGQERQRPMSDAELLRHAQG